jgi:hypothetical protein
MYSRDVEHRKDSRIYHNVDFWAKYNVEMIRTNNGGRWSATFATAKAGLLEWDGNREGRKLGQFDARFGWNSNHSYY